MSGSVNLACLSHQQRKSIEEHKAACLSRYQDAQKLASAIFSTKARRGWRVEAERTLAASPGLEVEARKAMNRMMEK